MRIAVLDMNNGEPNLGLKSITDLLDQRFSYADYQVFDVRQHRQVPDLNYDIYISSGGPGHPMDGSAQWGPAYFDLCDALRHHNEVHEDKKHVFFICHSFQIACAHYGIGKISRRPRPSFGLFPARQTEEGFKDPIFRELPNPFCIADFRRYQVLKPNFDRLEAINGEILAIEHEARLPHTSSALMAFRIGECIYGAQFHPEAYPEGMLRHITEADRREQIIEDHGATVYEAMMVQLRDPTKLTLTYEKVLPEFLKSAIKRLSSSVVPVQ